MYKFVLHPEAEKDYTESIIWYEKQKNDLGVRFVKTIEKYLQRIENYPESFAFSKPPYREIIVLEFPFTIVYQVNRDKGSIFIAAIYHTKRNPRKKYRKL